MNSTPHEPQPPLRAHAGDLPHQIVGAIAPASTTGEGAAHAASGAAAPVSADGHPIPSADPGRRARLSASSSASASVDPGLSEWVDRTQERVTRTTSRLWRGPVVAFAFILVLTAFVVVRGWLLGQQGLGADEYFSLAMATGHSLEHSAASADATLGDFRQGTDAPLAAYWAAYLAHDADPAGPWRVTRAVFLSDTSPPLYYLVLNGWTRIFGTSDGVLRWLSVFFAIVCVVPLCALARRAGGRAAVLPALVLFAAAPAAIYYSTEGRMYAMVWLFVLGAAWAATRARNSGSTSAFVVLALLTAGGLMTHYFAAFPLLGAWIWLMAHPGTARRWQVFAASATTAVLVAPWYVQVPRSLRAWRVTGGWLEREWPDFRPMWEFARFAWSGFSNYGDWKGHATTDWVVMAALAVALAASVFRYRGRLGSMLTDTAGWRLPVLMATTTLVCPLLFDLLKGSYVVAIWRYSVPGLPVLLLLAAVVLGRVWNWLRAILLVAIVAAWVPGITQMFTVQARGLQPFREIGYWLRADTRAADLVVLHSIPSGVLGVSRYMGDAESPVLPWVGQLGERKVPEDIALLMAGKRSVWLVKIHDVFEPAPQEKYLEQHATREWFYPMGQAWIIRFIPKEGRVFPSPPETDDPTKAPATSMPDPFKTP